PAAFAMVVLAEDLRPKIGDPTVRAEVEAQLKEVLADVNRRVAEYEQLRMLVVVSDPWSIENGLLTPTMKIKRSKIESAVAAKIEQWYTTPGQVIWA
ncbi:MAG: AMP-binding acetyl-CoA synthetase, partial [Burkholderiaceae bacterium]|nr:AMP-binding acetyl-CoA synthetase [Burkholderiaceae bacterium]